MLVCDFFEVVLYKLILHPVLANLPGFAVGNQLVWIKRNLKIKIVVYHELKGLSGQTLSFIFAYFFGFNFFMWTIPIAINPTGFIEFI